MPRIIHKRKFFQTLEEAKSFRKSHGGVLYASRGRSRQDYLVEKTIEDPANPDLFEEVFPFCIAWNETIQTARGEL
ncbi:MAG: hypothetical protein J6S14_15545 [Clostridia bacterium]|nr:hypothetical protein [Clostridia bacterium]